MKIAFFDFDGTITSKDSMAYFIKYAVGKRSYYSGLILMSPILIGFILRIIPNNIAKEKLISHFFKRWELTQFQKVADKYSLEQIDKIIRPKAMERIRWHQKQSHSVVIVSASMQPWLVAWCEKNNIALISTKLEVRKGKLTGKFATKNCYGVEKENRIREVYNLDSYEYIYAYGDSSGDKEMLSLADKSFYRPFRNDAVLR